MSATMSSLRKARFFFPRPNSFSTSISRYETSEPPILNLSDTESLFLSFSTKKLLSSYMILNLSVMEPLVELGAWMVNKNLIKRNMTGEVIRRALKSTFYDHFCVGEDAQLAGKCVTRLYQTGLRGMIDFAVEHSVDDDACNRNFEGFRRTIEFAATLPPSSVSFVIVKITAICPISLLERVSDLLRWEHKVPSLNLSWKHHSFPLFSESSALYHTRKEPEPLTRQEEKDLQLCQERLFTLCKTCQEASIPLMVDAEDTLLQPAIDYLTHLSAIRFNKDGHAIVFGTVQTYLRDAKERILMVTEAAEEMGITLGFKLVRGAYMVRERRIASSLGHRSPIHNTIQETHDCYNECASFLLDKVENGSGALVLATHNVESVNLAVSKALDMGIGKGFGRLEFAQLYGMADSLSLGLINAGFQVSKYMPFGPVEMVMPYLLRRADENRGVLSASSLDRELMRKEIWRRVWAALS